MGRWLSPDLIGGNIGNPQSLNRYAYVFNNPLAFIDPDGLDGAAPDATQGELRALLERFWHWLTSGSGGGGGCTGTCGVDPPQFPFSQYSNLRLFPQGFNRLNSSSIEVNWRLRNANGKSGPGASYLVFEHLSQCGANGTTCMNGEAIGPIPFYRAQTPGYPDLDPNVMRDSYGGMAASNKLQWFTIQPLGKAPFNLMYNPKSQIPVLLHYDGKDWAFQSINKDAGESKVTVNGYSTIPDYPEITGEH
jgi:hypothetical protein